MLFASRQFVRSVITWAATAALAGFLGAPPAQAHAQQPNWSAPVGVPQLGLDLGSILDRSVSSGSWGVMVVSLSRGDTLFNRNADSALLPASTMKVFTSAIALDYLGPYHQFETEVLREGPIEAGVLLGDLVLRGAGDPSFALSIGQDPLRILAQKVAASGIRQVQGKVIGDGSAFEDRRVPEGWLSRYLHASYAARVSALSYNEGIVQVTVRRVGARAEVSLRPVISGLPISNTVTIREGSRSAAITVSQDSRTGAFRIGGWIGASSAPRGYTYVIENPELFAAAAFRAALAAEGVRVTGTVGAREALPTAERVAGLPSRPLADLITAMNGTSNNHYAELLFRNTARANGTIGSADTGNALLRSFLADKVGTASARDVFAADGSGLSTLDRVTPRSLVSVLDYSARAPWASVFTESLPIAGQTETLKSRMRGAPASGNLRAKTGSTAEVTSLGGYVTAANGEQLAFAFIYNGRDRTRARDAIDAMGSTLAAFTRF
jgi:D-alanyl-D-alanine carboxypeptidase/D-alanyl-D-alanine-endopeptidase (penicillin-binding protein 4)